MTRNWGSPTLVNMGMILSLSLFHLGATKHVEHLRCRPRLQDGIGCELLGLRIIGSPNPFSRLREIIGPDRRQPFPHRRLEQHSIAFAPATRMKNTLGHQAAFEAYTVGWDNGLV